MSKNKFFWVNLLTQECLLKSVHKSSGQSCQNDHLIIRFWLFGSSCIWTPNLSVVVALTSKLSLSLRLFNLNWCHLESKSRLMGCCYICILDTLFREALEMLSRKRGRHHVNLRLTSVKEITVTKHCSPHLIQFSSLNEVFFSSAVQGKCYCQSNFDLLFINQHNSLTYIFSLKHHTFINTE